MKFSIRDLVLVTVIFALTVGWWVERRKRLDAQIDGRAWKVVTGENDRRLRSETGPTGIS